MRLLFCSLLCSLSLGLQAQAITSVTYAPSNPLTCNALTVTVMGQIGCINATLNGSSSSVVGNIIYVDIDVFQPPICLPAIFFYTQVETIPANTIPPGMYTLTARYFENGVQLFSTSQPIDIGSCCGVDATFAASANAACPGDSIAFIATDTTLNNYVWTQDGMVVAQNYQTTLSFPQSGTFNIQLWAADSTCSDSSQQAVMVELPQLSFPQVNMESCPGEADGAIDLQVNGGVMPYSYAWSNGDSIQDLSQLSTGSYAVTVTDAIGCEQSDSVSVGVGTAVDANFAASSDTLICPDTPVDFTDNSTGATDFSWYAGGSLFALTPNATYLFADTGHIQVLLVAANSTCADSAFLNFYVSPPPSLMANVTDVTCKGAGDGAIDLMVSGGFSPYFFNWDNGQTTEDLSQLDAGTYPISVSDSLGCTVTDSFVVINGPGIMAGFTSMGDSLLCPGDSLMLMNTSSGGTNFAWYKNGNLFSQMSDAALLVGDSGDIVIQLVANDSLCSDTSEASFQVVSAPAVNVSIMDETCPGDGDGSLTIQLNGGSGPFTYDWSNGANGDSLGDLTAGLYMLTLTDDAGCESLDSFMVATLGGLEADFAYTLLDSGAQFNDLSDSTTVSWLWDFGDGDTSHQASPIHVYPAKGSYAVCLTVTDAFGCQSQACDTLGITLSLTALAPVRLKLYPNPAHTQLSLEWPGRVGEALDIRLYDARGSLVFEQHRPAKALMQLSVETLPAGMYEIWLTSKQGHYHGRFMRR